MILIYLLDLEFLNRSYTQAIKYIRDKHDMQTIRDIIAGVTLTYIIASKIISSIVGVSRTVLNYKSDDEWYQILADMLSGKIKYLLIKYEYNLYRGYRKVVILVEN